MYECVECGKSISFKKAKGSMKHPYCKKCFKKIWNNNYKKYNEWIEKGGGVIE